MQGIVICGKGMWLENAIFEINRAIKNGGEKQFDLEYYISDDELTYVDIPRYSYKEAPDIDLKYLIIACHDKDYLEIKQRLIAKGKKEFDEFIGYRLFGKKVCVINANCYGFMVKQYLEQNSEFREIYGIYPVPAVHLNEQKAIDENVIKHTDLFIHQDIRKNNAISEKLSDDYIMPLLKKDCKSVCIPNFVGLLDGFYPNIGEEIFSNIDNATMFFQDKVIDEAYRKCPNSLNDVLDYINSYKINDEIIWQNFDIMVDKWRRREKNWDVKIVDYILENYQCYQMFEDPSHPSETLLNEICVRLLEKLEIKNVNFEKHYHGGCAMEIFMLPQVKKALGMKWDKKKIRIYTVDYCYHDRQPIDFRQYVQEYIWRVFGRVLV